MKFERARSDDQISNRKEEIIQACGELYDKAGFEGVTFKAIGEMTSFSRPTIYNYYKVKEDIMLDLLYREVQHMAAQLQSMMSSHDKLNREEYCKELATIYSNNKRMLSLICILYSTIEKNCTLESLIAFKKKFMVALLPLSESVDKYFPTASAEAKTTFIYNTSCFVSGLYPTTIRSEKQKMALTNAGIEVQPLDFYTLCYQGFLGLSYLL